jgi:3',5'-nucleoside bisphosphate phosphatase
VDLHLHSTASDGSVSPGQVVVRAKAAGLRAMALTDHDTLAGLPEAMAEGARLGIRVVGGCEFSVRAPWQEERSGGAGGELHVLGYFLQPGQGAVERFLEERRADRTRRGAAMVERLCALGVALEPEDLVREADGGAVGRPHLARLLLRRGLVSNVQEAFDRYLGVGRAAYVDKRLPGFREVADLVHAAGGVVSAAHLRDRGTRRTLTSLAALGLDAVETRHPRHYPELRARLTGLALELNLARTGGSDWHGDELAPNDSGSRLGGQQVPEEWLVHLESRCLPATSALVD